MSKKKNIGNAIFLVLVFAITIYCIFNGQNLSQLLFYIKNADMRYWFPAIFCVIFFIAGESIIIYYMMTNIGQKLKFGHCLLYSFVGFFFSCITPGASGGQPMQIYYMKKDKIPISVSTLVLMIVTITYKFVLVMIGLLVVIFRPSEIMLYLDPIIGWVYLGIALNVFAVGSMFVLVFHSTLAKNIVNICVRILNKLHFIKHKDKIQQKVDHTMQQYGEVADYFRVHKTVVWNVLLITIVQRFLLFFVTYLAYLSCGFHAISMPVITMLQGMISVAVDMLPLPGGMGISESLFMTMFDPILHEVTLAVMVISRGLSYYTELIISAIMTLVAHFKIGGK